MDCKTLEETMAKIISFPARNHHVCDNLTMFPCLHLSKISVKQAAIYNNYKTEAALELNVSF